MLAHDGRLAGFGLWVAAVKKFGFDHRRNMLTKEGHRFFQYWFLHNYSFRLAELTDDFLLEVFYPLDLFLCRRQGRNNFRLRSLESIGFDHVDVAVFAADYYVETGSSGFADRKYWVYGGIRADSNSPHRPSPWNI